MKGLLNSLRDVFWFGSSSNSELLQESQQEGSDRDVFYLCEETEGVESRLERLVPFFEGFFGDAEVEVNDAEWAKDYVNLTILATMPAGDLRLVFYDNGELVLRGERELVEETLEPIEDRLDVSFERV